ncbi:MAG: branched-chain amino acid transaminase [Acidobacteria bacterium]|nr:branched-chain amino acid transaminase [Acidobacteriota bacterium]MCB9399325.1 branched-chain amino acid transaminase [Acidobacteriota bacterium]
MSIKEAQTIWMDGKLVPWHEAQVHVLSHALHYGTSVFEGIRLYETPQGPLFFRLDAHIKRLFQSARMYRIEIPYDVDQVMDACHELVKANDLSNAYLRPIIFGGYGSMGLLPKKETPWHLAIAAFEWPSLLGADGIQGGVSVGISSWRRPAPDTHPTLAKAGGNYLSSILICEEAHRNGYDEGLALDINGMVSEGPGENLFVVRNGKVMTPGTCHSILEGITRDSVMQLLAERGIQVEETSIPREYLYVADELFFTGTAAEVVPIRSLDGIQVGGGEPGPITRQVQTDFFGLFNGSTPDRWGWLQPLLYAHAWF